MPGPSLIGREGELAELRALLERACGGQGGTALIVAEPGGGKTRLAAEARALADETGMVTLWGTASEATSAIPLLPLAQALNNILDNETLGTIRPRLRPAHGVIAIIAPALFPDQGPRGHLEEAGKPALFEALIDVLKMVAAKAGTLIVLDDAQWADPTTHRRSGRRRRSRRRRHRAPPCCSCRRPPRDRTPRKIGARCTVRGGGTGRRRWHGCPLAEDGAGFALAAAGLSDYYVKKVGSQEIVAERHFLTRPTFYRRLHLGCWRSGWDPSRKPQPAPASELRSGKVDEDARAVTGPARA